MTAAKQQGRKVLAFPGLAGKFARLSSAAVFETRMGDAAKIVLAALATYANPAGRCWPSVGTLAARLKISDRAVKSHLKVLRDLGYIEIEKQGGSDGAGRRTNVYVLAYPAGLDDSVPAPANEPEPVKPSFTGADAAGVKPSFTGQAATSEAQLHPTGEDLAQRPVKPSFTQTIPITRSSNYGGADGSVDNSSSARFDRLVEAAASAAGIEPDDARKRLLKMPSATRDRLLSFQASGSLEASYLATILEAAHGE